MSRQRGAPLSRLAVWARQVTAIGNGFAIETVAKRLYWAHDNPPKRF